MAKRLTQERCLMLENWVAHFDKVLGNPMMDLGGYFWHRQREADKLLHTPGVGLALHTVVCLMARIWRDEKRRAKFIAMLTDVAKSPL